MPGQAFKTAAKDFRDKSLELSREEYISLLNTAKQKQASSDACYGNNLFNRDTGIRTAVYYSGSGKMRTGNSKLQE